MIVAKTPLRVPLAGGPSDIREFADLHGGLTLSATIDKHIYVAVKRNHGRVFELRYLNTYERAERVDGIRHDHIREALKLTGLQRRPLDITVVNDLGHEGGLGSSGSLAAALLTALRAFKGEAPSPEQIIEEASRLEMDILDGASGYHDHTITHLGGCRLLEYRGGRHAELPLGVAPVTLGRFLRRLMLFYSGWHAKTKPSLVLLAANIEAAAPGLEAMKANVLRLRESLARDDLDAAGECLQRQQDLKQKLPGSFENEFVLETMRRARELGVAAHVPGGKVGAFLLVYRPRGMKRKAVIRHFGDLLHVPFRFEPEGTRCCQV